VLGSRSTGDEANAVSRSSSSPVRLLLLLLLLLLTTVSHGGGGGGRLTLSEAGGRCPTYADSSRLAGQDATESGAKRLAEERVDDRIGRRRHVAPPDHRRRHVGVAEPSHETRRTEDRDDVDEEERRPEESESQQNNS